MITYRNLAPVFNEIYLKFYFENPLEYEYIKILEETFQKDEKIYLFAFDRGEEDCDNKNSYLYSLANEYIISSIKEGQCTKSIYLTTLNELDYKSILIAITNYQNIPYPVIWEDVCFCSYDLNVMFDISGNGEACYVSSNDVKKINNVYLKFNSYLDFNEKIRTQKIFT